MDVQKVELIMKGLANHHRLSMMLILKKNPKINLLDLASLIGANYRTASEHSRRLRLSGLVITKYKGQEVLHELTPLGISALKYISLLKK